jgi:hypothetical protein
LLAEPSIGLSIISCYAGKILFSNGNIKLEAHHIQQLHIIRLYYIGRLRHIMPSIINALNTTEFIQIPTQTKKQQQSVLKVKNKKNANEI